MIALIRAFARASANTIGNFWVDLTRCTLYILLPLSIVAALFLVWQGVPQNIGAYVDATTLEGAKQTLSQGPAASQIAIKQLGTNGGGFWNANSAVPYENPTPLSNFLQVLYILLISAALTHTFGRMVKDERQGWALYAAMSVDLPRLRRRSPTGPSPPAIRTLPRSGSTPPTWKARRSASASPIRACGRSRPPPPRTAPSTRCTTASRRSAA